MIKHIIAIGLILSVSIGRSYASDSTFLQPDAFLNMVLNFHPAAQSAKLEKDKAEAKLLKAKGAFDPNAYGSTNWKQLDDKAYYQIWEAGVKAPIWPGMTLEGGYENNTGTFINPENSTSSNGLWFAGLNISLLRGLTTDERRTALRKARIDIIRSVELQQLRLNDLLLDAANTYWQWWLSYQLLEVQRENLQVSQQRFEFVKGIWQQGDIAAIDTLEAFVQWQNRRVDLQKAQIRYLNNSFSLSQYLWTEDGTPLFLEENVFPPELKLDYFQTAWQETLQDDQNILVANHPAIKSLQLSREQLDLDLRLNKEMLKPVLDLKYQFINTAERNNSLSMRDYRWGAGVYLPLALRKQKAEINFTKIKQLETDFYINEQKQKLEAKRAALRNTIAPIADNLNIFENITTQYKTLLEAEQNKFQMGESTVFLLNARENQYLQSMQNWYQLHYDLIYQVQVWKWHLDGW